MTRTARLTARLTAIATSIRSWQQMTAISLPGTYPVIERCIRDTQRERLAIITNRHGVVATERRWVTVEDAAFGARRAA